MSELQYWVWLSVKESLRPSAKLRLLRRFGTPERVYYAAAGELESAGLRGEELKSVLDREMRTAGTALARCAAGGVRIITMDDTEYPFRLKNIADPPILLYVRGALLPVDEVPVIAAVGTRSCTQYGLRTARRLGRELGQAGFVLATGLARGIDSAVAQGTLEAGGAVIAVTGGGPDVIYPPENEALYEAVLHRGCIVSEYAPGTLPIGGHFPVRNRILSGLSLGTVVVEAPRKSGALITAQQAVDQGRDVFAVPGPIDEPACAGSNQLLRDGATPITCARDVVEEYASRFAGRRSTGESVRVEVEPPEEKPADDNKTAQKSPEKIDKPQIGEYTALHPVSLDGDDRVVALAITEENMVADEIIAASGLGAGKTLAALTRLEILGAVKRADGKRYTRCVTVK